MLYWQACKVLYWRMQALGMQNRFVDFVDTQATDTTGVLRNRTTPLNKKYNGSWNRPT
jgi:hypothetical protein